MSFLLIWGDITELKIALSFTTNVFFQVNIRCLTEQRIIFKNLLYFRQKPFFTMQSQNPMKEVYNGSTDIPLTAAAAAKANVMRKKIQR